jgi:hypothetical protein
MSVDIDISDLSPVLEPDFHPSVSLVWIKFYFIIFLIV